MCGIVGYITGETHRNTIDRRRFIEQALIIDTLRGEDSAGLFAATKEQDWNVRDGRPTWAKAIGDGYRFICSKEYQTIFEHNRVKDYKFVVGHNRAATVGGVSIKTAHPFQEGPITMVHNGTLDTTWTLPQSQLDLDAHNDSHAICHNLALTEDAVDVIERLSGAFALVWHDARDDSLNLVRNSQRPFHMAMAAHDDTIYFASEGEMLYWLDARLKLSLEEIVSLQPGNILKFRPGNLMVPEVTKVDLTKKVRTFPYSGQSNKGGTSASTNYWTKNLNPDPPAGRSSKLSLNDKIELSGRKITIPERMQEELIYCDLMPEVLEAFVPCRAVKVWKGNRSTYTVIGYLEGRGNKVQGPTCTIYGVGVHTWEQASTRLWSVQPVGVKYLYDKMPCVIGRMYNSMAPDGSMHYVKKRLPIPAKILVPTAVENEDEEFGDEEHEYNHLDDDRTFVGPNNEELTATQFLIATSSGCINCGGALGLEDADTLEWVNGGHDPMCSDCVEEIMDLNDTKGATVPWTDDEEDVNRFLH